MARQRTEPVIRIVKQWQLNPWLLLEAGDDGIELLTAGEHLRERDPASLRRDGYHEADAPDPAEYAEAMHKARIWKAAVHAWDKQFVPAERARAFAALEDRDPGFGAVISARTVTTFLRDYHAVGAGAGMDVFARIWAPAE